MLAPPAASAWSSAVLRCCKDALNADVQEGEQTCAADRLHEDRLELAVTHMLLSCGTSGNAQEKTRVCSPSSLGGVPARPGRVPAGSRPPL